jgi:hypothetical protein
VSEMDAKQLALLDRAADRLYEYGCIPYWEVVKAAKAELLRLRTENESLKQEREQCQMARSSFGASS